MNDEPHYRPHYIPSVNWVNLNIACEVINQSMDGFGCYLVGSSLQRRDHWDVDVRYIMYDDKYDHLFRGPDGGWKNGFWSLMCTTISFWLSQQSGLQVDFQIQRQTQANATHKEKLRNALGITFDYPGERPSDLGVT